MDVNIYKIAISCSNKDYTVAKALQLFLLEHFDSNDIFLYAPDEPGSTGLTTILRRRFLDTDLMVQFLSERPSGFVEVEASALEERFSNKDLFELVLLGESTPLPDALPKDVEHLRLVKQDWFLLAEEIQKVALRITRKLEEKKPTVSDRLITVNRHLKSTQDKFKSHNLQNEEDVQKSIRSAATLFGFCEQKERMCQVVSKLESLSLILLDAVDYDPNVSHYNTAKEGLANVPEAIRQILSVLSDSAIESSVDPIRDSRDLDARDFVLLVRLRNYFHRHDIYSATYRTYFPVLARLLIEDLWGIPTEQRRSLFSKCKQQTESMAELLKKFMYEPIPVQMAPDAGLGELIAFTDNAILPRVLSRRVRKDLSC